MKVIKISSIISLVFIISCASNVTQKQFINSKREIANKENSCGGLLDGFFSLFKSNSAIDDGLRAESKNKIKTRIKLSGQQSKQDSSILEDMRVLSRAIDDANRLLLEKDIPEEIYVLYDEKMAKREASILLHQMNLANLINEDPEKNTPIAIHEYFHFILNSALTKRHPEFSKIFSQDLLSQNKSRTFKKIKDKEMVVNQIVENLNLIDMIEKDIKLYQTSGTPAFHKKNLSYVDLKLKKLNNLELISQFKKITFESSNQFLANMSLYRDQLNREKVTLEKMIKENLKQNLDEDGLSDTGTELEISSLISFYSTSIHELFADLGAVLTLNDPAAIKNLLDENARDFTKPRSLDECYSEYFQSGKFMSNHNFLSYNRGLIWNQYFAKVPLKERNSKWPIMLDKLKEAFVEEMINNPKNLNLDPLEGSSSNSFLDFNKTNFHVEQIIKNTLQDLI